MSTAKVVFNGFSFEENDIIITWAQKYLLWSIGLSRTPEWTAPVIDNLRYNIMVDIYKIFFLESEINTQEKKDWAIKSVEAAIKHLAVCSHEKFEDIMGEKVAEDIKAVTRVKDVLGNVLTQLRS